MLKRALNELTVDAFETVLDLIAGNNLYRGKEFQKSVDDFYQVKLKYDGLSDNDKELFCWEHIDLPSARIRNTAIGTLLVDLSEGRDLESAVTAYERVVAPNNYKRPTALVTPKMVEDAKATVVELGLERSLERRYANQTDLTVNNCLWVNRSVPTPDLFGEITNSLLVNVKKLGMLPEMPITKFLDEVVPGSTNIEVLLEDRLKSNFVTLVAPTNSDAGLLFKWDNNFSWSYADGMADSIKQRVKSAGGRVDGYLRISLGWKNTDDLDLHVMEPNGNHICFSAKRSNVTHGELDIDMNVNNPVRDAVENVIYPEQRFMLDGEYTVKVHNFTRRESADVGFTVELEVDGNLTVFEHAQSPSSDEYTEVLRFSYSKVDGIKILSGNSTGSNIVSNQVYGVGTNKFHRVTNLLLSPNYWGDNRTGNKHYFFMLDGTKADTSPRGIFNEFLKPELEPHRKVFEILGNTMTVGHSDDQLNGVGFSETIPNNLVVRVDNKLIKVLF